MHLESFSGVRCLATLGRCGRRSWQLLLHPVAGECAICEWRYLLVPRGDKQRQRLRLSVSRRQSDTPVPELPSLLLDATQQRPADPHAARGPVEKESSGNLADSLLGCLHTAATDGVSVEVHGQATSRGEARAPALRHSASSRDATPDNEPRCPRKTPPAARATRRQMGSRPRSRCDPKTPQSNE